MKKDRSSTKPAFEAFMSQLLKTNATLGYYTDFEKCYANVSKIALKLNAMNYLIGKEDLLQAISELWEENPKTFSVLDILIAVRRKDKKMCFNRQKDLQLIERYFDTKEGVVEYIYDTGLAEVLRNKQITNLVDYVFGVEVGLDTNARKNRSGDIMEDLVADILDSYGVKFRREVYSREFPLVYEALGVDSKRFDFVVETPKKTYLIEANFYSTNGSKLNEVARSYSELAPKINACEGYEFVWITDVSAGKVLRANSKKHSI